MCIHNISFCPALPTGFVLEVLNLTVMEKICMNLKSSVQGFFPFNNKLNINVGEMEWFHIMNVRQEVSINNGNEIKQIF